MLNKLDYFDMADNEISNLSGGLNEQSHYIAEHK